MSLKRRLRRLEELQGHTTTDTKEKIKAISHLIELKLFQNKTDEEIELLIKDDPLLMREWKERNEPLPMTLQQKEVEKKLFN